MATDAIMDDLGSRIDSHDRFGGHDRPRNAGLDRPGLDKAGLDRAALSAIRLLFDRAFYLSRYTDVAANGIDPLDHFLTAGLGEGRSPCLLFDPDFYLGQPGAPSSPDFLFLHYLRSGIADGIDPHPLIDAGFYAGQAPALRVGTNPLIHMLTAGRREGRRPNRLFDVDYYRRRLRRDDRMLHPLVHYALRGWLERRQPHPLFDPVTYLEQRPDIAAAGIDPLAHYLRHGRFEQVRTHWLFDAAHYVSLCPDGIGPDDALLHFATAGCGPGRSPNPLFDATHYRRQHPDLTASGIDPFLHFLEFGLAENRDPHPLFDTWFYNSQNTDVAETDVAPFIHYVRYGAREGRDPSALFPAASYLDRHPEAGLEAAGPLAHFLRSRELHLERLCHAFDPAYYLACHPSCAEAVAAGVSPLSHYCSTGRGNGFSGRPLALELHGWTGPARAPHDAGADDTTSGVPVAAILLVLQDASYGDATSCALHAMQRMGADPDLACRVVIRHGGPLASGFAALAPTLVIDADRSGVSGETDRMAEILHSFRDMSPDGIVIVAGAGMPDVVLLSELLCLGLIAWLHETPVSIDCLLGGDRTMQALARVATRIVTGSEAARAALVRHYRLPDGQVVSLADGVAAPGPGLDASHANQALRERLGLQPDAMVVLGGGGVEFRNGTDLFILVASQVIARGQRDSLGGSAPRQPCFLWIGPDDDPLFAGLCRSDIERLDLSEHVRLLGPEDVPGSLLPGADLFLHTARDIVLDAAGLEARSSGLPVIGFGGTSPAGGGLVQVGYLDIDAMSDAVIDCGNHPPRRTHPRAPAALGPSWAGWHHGLRRLLAEQFGVPVPDQGGPIREA